MSAMFLVEDLVRKVYQVLDVCNVPSRGLGKKSLSSS